MEKRYQGKWSTSTLADCCWTLVRNAPEQLHKRQAKRSRKLKRTFIVKCLMYVFLKYIINVCGFLRNCSQFWVFIVIFVLSASKLIRNGYYYRRSFRSVNICCPVLWMSSFTISRWLRHRLWSTVNLLPWHAEVLCCVLCKMREVFAVLFVGLFRNIKS
jgi:cation transport ATPase